MRDTSCGLKRYATHVFSDNKRLPCRGKARLARVEHQVKAFHAQKGIYTTLPQGDLSGLQPAFTYT